MLHTADARHHTNDALLSAAHQHHANMPRSFLCCALVSHQHNHNKNQIKCAHPELRQLASAQPRQLGQPHIGQLDAVAQHLHETELGSGLAIDQMVQERTLAGTRVQPTRHAVQMPNAHQARQAGQGRQLRDAVVSDALTAAQADTAQRAQQAHALQLPVLKAS